MSLELDKHGKPSPDPGLYLCPGCREWTAMLADTEDWAEPLCHECAAPALKSMAALRAQCEAQRKLLEKCEEALKATQTFVGYMVQPIPTVKPTIEELEAMLSAPGPSPIVILPNGEIRAAPRGPNALKEQVDDALASLRQLGGEG